MLINGLPLVHLVIVSRRDSKIYLVKPSQVVCNLSGGVIPQMPHSKSDNGTSGFMKALIIGFFDSDESMFSLSRCASNVDRIAMCW